jgi:site-specific DNA recombinase
LKAFVESNTDKRWITSESLMYRDEGISGVAPVHERPALSRLKMDILEGRIDILLIWKIDRLYRQTRLLLEFVEFLKDRNIGFVAKQE